MIDLSDRCHCVLRAIITAPIAWQAPAQIAARLGGNREATLDALAELDAAGWIEPWELEGDLYVILTPRAAEYLAVRLVPGGRSETLRWASIDDPEPCPRAPGRGQGDVDALDLIPDTAPGPEAEAEAAERAERIARRPFPSGERPDLSTLPRPSILLGSGLTPWPGPRTPHDHKSCPGCGSKPISEKAYCLVCDRWGLDHLLTASRGQAPPARRASRPTPNQPRESLTQASARAARKEKHRRKLAEREKQARGGGLDGSKTSPSEARPSRRPVV